MHSTLASWAALLAVGLGLAHYYNPQLLARLLQRWQQPTSAPEAPEVKKKKKRSHLRPDGEEKSTSTPVSSNEAPISKKRTLVSAPVEKTVKITTTKGAQVTIPRDEEGDMSNREFAQQLAKAQVGTKLEKTAGPTTERRAVRPGKAFESPSLSAETSSTGGGDGDDDLSLAGSSPQGPVSTAPTSRAGDVSDMLEAPTAKPTTLRLTDIPVTKSKPAAKPVEQPLTQKQRQRKARQEENQRLQEEAENKRKKLEEQQRHRARTAEGTSKQAKASSFTPSQNAWKKESKPQAAPAPLLDTFKSETTKTNGQPLTNITNGGFQGKRPGLSWEASWADEVNEEEQSKWEKELVQEEQWEPVASKKSKKKKKETDTGSETSTSVAPTQSKPNGTNGVKTENVHRFQAIENLGGSDWEA